MQYIKKIQNPKAFLANTTKQGYRDLFGYRFNAYIKQDSQQPHELRGKYTQKKSKDMQKKRQLRKESVRCSR